MGKCLVLFYPSLIEIIRLSLSVIFDKYVSIRIEKSESIQHTTEIIHRISFETFLAAKMNNREDDSSQLVFFRNFVYNFLIKSILLLVLNSGHPTRRNIQHNSQFDKFLTETGSTFDKLCRSLISFDLYKYPTISTVDHCGYYL